MVCHRIIVAQHRPTFLRFLRHHRLDQEGKRFYDLHAVSYHLRCRRPVGLDQFPRRIGLDIGVAKRGKAHDRIHGDLELIIFHCRVDCIKTFLDLGHGCGICLALRHAFEFLVGKKERAVDKVTKDIDDLVIDPLLKHFPRKVEFLCMVGVREQVVPQILRREPLIKIIVVCPDHVSPGL